MGWKHVSMLRQQNGSLCSFHAGVERDRLLEERLVAQLWGFRRREVSRGRRLRRSTAGWSVYEHYPEYIYTYAHCLATRYSEAVRVLCLK